MLKRAGLGLLLASVLTACGGSTSVQSQCLGASTSCSGTCVELTSDNLNCGACGNACAAGKVCSAGACAVTCAAGLVDCGGKCVDPMTDRAFCGASGSCTGGSAGAACDSGQVCSAGACALSCQPGLVDCGGTCLDPQNDPRACGADATCGGGQTCGAGFACDVGQCVLSCQTGLVDCGGKCIDPATDRTFCGASGDCAGTNDGAVCSSGQVCSDGTCTTSCPSSEYACGGKCIDPQSDPNYCGAASNCSGGAVCGPSSACYRGLCEPLCATGQVMCNGTCIDPQTDQAYCGASGFCAGATVGAACSAEQTCVAGVCTPPPCTWTEAAVYALDAAPAGSAQLKGLIGSQGPAAVYGRTAWYQTSDWNFLFVPLGALATTEVVAVEADTYLSNSPPTSTGIGIFQPVALGENQIGAIAELGWTAAAPWSSQVITSTFTAPGVWTATRTDSAPYFDGWHTIRVEAVRSLCRFRALVDGTELRRWEHPGCAISGTYVNLVGGWNHAGWVASNVAWSNLKLYGGSAANCVPAP